MRNIIITYYFCVTERRFWGQSSVLRQTLPSPGLRLIKDQASGEIQAPGESRRRKT